MVVTEDSRWLSSVLKKRIQQNPRYSLRLLAKKTHLSPSFLSKVLSGERNITARSGHKMLNHMTMNQDESLKLKKLILLNSLNSPKTAKQKKINYLDLPELMYSYLSDWTYMGVLQVLRLKETGASIKWLCEILELEKIDLEIILYNLEMMDLIKKIDGKWHATQVDVKSTDEVKSEAIRKFHRGILMKAMESLEKDDLCERSTSTMLFPIDSSCIDEIKKEIKKFRRKIDLIANKGRRKDRLYSLSISFFPLSKKTI